MRTASGAKVQATVAALGPPQASIAVAPGVPAIVIANISVWGFRFRPPPANPPPGLFESLNRPGGDLTGTTTLTLETGSLQLQLLHEIVQAATSFALLINPTSPNLANTQALDLRAAARSLGL